jgi:hypothetical protein
MYPGDYSRCLEMSEMAKLQKLHAMSYRLRLLAA